jgi:hypothetical protein
MTAPSTGLIGRVRDGALYLLKLTGDSPDAGRVSDLAELCLELIHDRIGATVYYDETTVPLPIVEAGAVATSEMYRRKDAPFGIVNAWSEDGASIRISRDPLAGVEYLLAPYRLRGSGQIA